MRARTRRRIVVAAVGPALVGCGGAAPATPAPTPAAAPRIQAPDGVRVDAVGASGGDRVRVDVDLQLVDSVVLVVSRGAGGAAEVRVGGAPRGARGTQAAAPRVAGADSASVKALDDANARAVLAELVRLLNARNVAELDTRYLWRGSEAARAALYRLLTPGEGPAAVSTRVDGGWTLVEAGVTAVELRFTARFRWANGVGAPREAAAQFALRCIRDGSALRAATLASNDVVY
jgi:hypothetical protein